MLAMRRTARSDRICMVLFCSFSASWKSVAIGAASGPVAQGTHACFVQGWVFFIDCGADGGE